MRVLLAIIFVSFQVFSQAQPYFSRPNLVVGIVVDQMRQDYIMRYWDLFGEGGFKKLVKNGYSFANAHYNYFPTYTGAGHANISTGASPSVNGIVANDWYEKHTDTKVYCASDPTVKGVGGDGVAGQMSPRRMLSSTLGDQLKLGSNDQSKVFGVSLKDRGAILSAGHMANAAYWYDGATGNFITSTYYMDELPKWVNTFNKKKLWDKYLDQIWKPVMDINKLLKVSSPDDNPYENVAKGMSKPTFPYDLKKLSKEYGPELITSVPWGNNIVLDFAKTLITEEKLGKQSATDLLFISLSTPDYMGHAYGPRAVEIADMYVRLDKELADFIKQLENQVGSDNFTLFLTADHAAADNPKLLTDKKMPAGLFSQNMVNIDLRGYLENTFGADLIDVFKNMQIYLKDDVVAEKGLQKTVVTDSIIRYLQNKEGVLRVFPASMLTQYNMTDNLMMKYQRGYFPQRCGDIYIVPQSGWLEMFWQTKGTTHGSPYSYDTHVPVIFYGKNITAGNSFDYVSVSQIAPTLAALLGITPPSASFDEPLIRYLRK